MPGAQRAHTRDRVVRVAEWAWPFVARHLESLTPGERLFRGLSRWDVGDAHRERLSVLGLPHHRVHDAPHFYAIRAMGTAVGTGSEALDNDEARKSLGSRALENSRGGTQTLDPGIMSAVL